MAGIQTIYPPTTYAQTLVPTTLPLTDISAFYSITGAPLMAYGADAIGGDIYNVLSTIVGDEVFEPTYGCDLPLRVFEPINARIELLCQQDVYFASRNWVPQAQVSTSQTTAYANADNRLVGVEVAYAYAGASWTVGTPLTRAFSGNL
jgi:phage baseplate assembly protein W